jgi:ribosomal protein L11 methyltransferase
MSLASQWVQLKIETQEPFVEALEDWFFNHDALSITYQDAADDPILEPALGDSPLWQQVKIMVLYPGDVDTKSIDRAFDSSPLAANVSSARWEVLEDKDWVRAWMDNYEPMQFGANLWICPSWQEPPNPDAVNIMLDPGLAFGTGTHPTTALCLTWLGKHAADFEHAIDYGCGSGILAIAALKLGVKQLLAVDYDPQAVIATKDNAERNQVDMSALTICLPEDDPKDKTPLMIANILADTLKSLKQDLADRVLPNGKIILSGILSSQADSVIEHYQPWFEMEQPIELNDWVLIVGTRNNS